MVWLTGFLLISTFPVFSSKQLDFSKTHTRLWIILLGSLLPFFHTHLYFMLGLFGVLSLASIPLSVNYYAKNKEFS